MIGHSSVFDALLVLVTSNFLFKGGWVVALYPWLLFKVSENETKRAILIHGLVAGLAIIPISRLVGSLFPFRLRPIHDAALAIHLAEGLHRDTLIGWTSFPSDHAALFAAIATPLMLLSAPIGAVAFGYVLLVIDLPRLCLGIHYPSDVVAGTLLGVAAGIAGGSRAVRNLTAGWGLRLWERNRGAFVVVFALIVYGMGIAFEPVPQLLRTVRNFGADLLHVASLY